MATPDTTALADRRSRAYPSRRVVLGSLSKDEDDPGVTSTAYDDMWVDWELIDDLCLGRDQMILKAQRWLPQEPKEEDGAYAVRLDRSFLFEAFSDTLEKLAAKPFSREVQLIRDELLPERLVPIAKDVDLQGTSLTQFAKKLLKDGYKYGHAAVFVDYPVAQPGATLGDEISSGARPYWVHVSPTNLVGWTTKIVDGKELVTSIRFVEERYVRQGLYGDKRVTILRRITAPDGDYALGSRGVVETFTRRDDTGKFVPDGPPRAHSYPGLPLDWLPVNPTGKGLLRSAPPLKGLAEMNLAHWQVASDERNILRFVAIAMLLITGVESSEADAEATGGSDEIAWGPNEVIHGPAGADGKYIEHSGAGVGALTTYRKSLEEHMEVLGMEPTMARQTDVTATGQMRDDAKITSGLQTTIRTLERLLVRLYEISARWIGEELDTDQKTGFGVDIFNEFGLKVASRSDAQQLLTAWTAGAISDELFLTEWKKRGLIGDEVDVAEELAKQQAAAAEKAKTMAPPAPPGFPGVAPDGLPPSEVPVKGKAVAAA